MRNSFKLRNLSIAAFTALATMGAAQANDHVAIPDPKPINISMPTPTLGENAGYVLSEELAKATDTSITYYSVENGVIVPHYYEYTIKPNSDADKSLLVNDDNASEYTKEFNRDFINASYSVTDKDGNTESVPAFVYDVSMPSSDVPTIDTITIKGDFINNTDLMIRSANSKISIEGNVIDNKAGLFTGLVGSSEPVIVENLKVNAFDNDVPGGIGLDLLGLMGGSGISEINESVFINNSNYGIFDLMLSPDLSSSATTQDPLEMFKNRGFFDGKIITNDENIETSLLLNSISFGGVLTSGNVVVKDSFFAHNKSELDGGAVAFSSGIIKGIIEMNLQVVNLTVTDKDGNVLDSGYMVKTSASLGDILAVSTYMPTNKASLDELSLISMLGLSKDSLSEEILEETITLDALNKKLNSSDKVTVDTLKDVLADDKVDLSAYFTKEDYAIVTNTSFINNVAGTDSYNANGGAIYSSRNLMVNADNNKDVIFKGNTVMRDGKSYSNAIYMDSISTGAATSMIMGSIIGGNNPELPVLTEEQENTSIAIPSKLMLKAENNGRVFMYDKISGRNGVFYLNNYYPENEATTYQVTQEESVHQYIIKADETVHYNIEVSGDETGHIYLLNDVENQPNISLSKTNLHLGRENVVEGSSLTLNSGTLHLLNNQVGNVNLSTLDVIADTNLTVDADLAKGKMDRLVADIYSGNAKINLVGLNILSDMQVDKDSLSIRFADKELMNHVNTTTLETSNGYQTDYYSPIYKYNLNYKKQADGGYFVFNRGGKLGSSDAFNPAVLGSSSTAAVGATATMNQAFNYAFQHSADHMNIPYLERVSMRDRNKYALSITGDATDMGRFSPLYQPSDEGSSVWVKPYATFENVPLKNGPKVSNITYGTLVGFDSEMQSLKRGWDRVWTGYIGYNGASQRYSGIDSTQNGGLIGGTMTLYKGNFFNATTVSVGANVANNQTMYGSEDFAMLLSGIGNKTGYNFEFKGGKCILQPSLLMSYTFVNTFDYTNAAGVKIDNKPLHALQLAPGVKVIGNLKNGWQPYASVSMVWNLMGESDATANGVKLPEMSIKPYVQYGVGLQKRIKDHFMAYGQAMVQNGGRNGVSLTAGFRWAIGHDNCKYEKTQHQPEVKQNLTMKQTKSSNGEILKQVQNDKGKRILKQMTP